MFAWDEPPPTGHPGVDYGCRCRAEPYEPEVAEYMRISLSNVSDRGTPWTSRDFVYHYFTGDGRRVLVRDTGHLRAVVAEYMRDVEHDLKGQIADEARSGLIIEDRSKSEFKFDG